MPSWRVARGFVKLTFVDAGVLIAAARGGSIQARRAMDILDDPERQFASSPFLRLEVLPQALFNKRTAEAAFYEVLVEHCDVEGRRLTTTPQPATEEILGHYIPTVWRFDGHVNNACQYCPTHGNQHDGHKDNH